MKEISKFLVEHWEVIGSGLLAIISVIVAAIKKRPSADVLRDTVYGYIGLFMASDINYAETHFDDGEQKKFYVINEAIKFVGKKMVLDEQVIVKIRDTVGPVIEAFLSTPTKKGK